MSTESLTAIVCVGLAMAGGLGLALAHLRRARIARLHAMIGSYRGMAARATSRDELLVVYRGFCWALAQGALLHDETARHAAVVREYMEARLAAPSIRITHAF